VLWFFLFLGIGRPLRPIYSPPKTHVIMDDDKKFELELRRFELDAQIKSAELELKKKETELKAEEQRSKKYSSPLMLSILAGFISIMTGIITKYTENLNNIKLEEKKFQSSLLLKATEAKNYDDFSNMLITLQENGLLTLPENKLKTFRKNRFVSEQVQQLAQNSGGTGEQKNQWVIVANSTGNAAKAGEVSSALQQGAFKDAKTWVKDGDFKTVITGYTALPNMAEDLFEVREQFGAGATVLEASAFKQWCPNSVWNEQKKVFECL